MYAQSEIISDKTLMCDVDKVVALEKICPHPNH
jgi:hypothetical protein